MMMADAAMEDSGTILDADADRGAESYPENMCISLDNIFAILDEPPLQPEHERGPLPAGTAEGFQEDDLARCQFNHVKDFQLHAASTGIPEDVIEQGYSPWDTSNYCVASDCEREMSSGFLFGSEGGSNKFNGMYSALPVDNGNLHASQCTESRDTLPSDHSSDWLRLSYGNGSCSLDSFGASSSGTLLSGNVDHQLLRNNVRKCSAPSVSVDQAGCMYLSYPYINDCYTDVEKKEGFEQMEGEIVFQPVQRVSKQDANNISSLCTLQNGESGAVPDSTEQVGNVYPSLSLCSSIDPNAAIQKVNAYGATDVTCDVSNSCLTLPRECSGDAEIAFDFSGQFFQQFFSNEHEELNHRKDERGNKLLLSQNSYGRCEVKLGIQKESLDSFLPEVSGIELDVPLPDILQTEQNSEDMSFVSESSTDSSPVPSSRNSTSDNIDPDVANKSKPLVLDLKLFPSNKQKPLTNYGRAEQFLVSHHQKNNVSSGGGVSIGKNSSINSLSVGDDFDICILDDISDPVCSSPPLVPARASTPLIPAKSHLISQHSGCTDPHYSGSGVMRFRPDDERLTYRIALQDLSQPKSEASPPDGVLAVPLLRHQRIALSWMVQKEIASPHCCGGILADDQGLGKTISTIALILTERSPSSQSCSLIKKQDEFEPLNLDDDDEVNVTKHPRSSSPVILSGPVKLENTAMVVKGRPAAGTLVVCPTSVLRQWAEELQNKVTSKGNLSVLVYHGSNRTKDPNELAKYDVVLTTYAIVSMEVPKQPLVDKDDEGKGKVDALGLSMEPLTGKKRKESSSSNTKDRKNRNMMDGALLESAARPLARVGWFRVVLDEAQSIKNYRTQVARACWGLRAKRRWCLSGTPIQNAVDDLYSYFRFLRYDPYAVYKSFCSTIKIPINRNPTNGYKKLQAVLKTVMLRRTKGTLLDGKPIITLPPKTVRLKKVDFSKEERTYYARLEAESREQFKVYADAGTVKENYVNILLMLLRLRQACDHPLLVRGFDSNSIWRSSLEMAKKLPRDKQMDLLRCLEASVAICTICNDAPEDAVVTICGHVFCNQCIFEHLTGDESICPSASCKVQLSAASVFSKGTLKSSLSSQSGHDCSGSDPEMVNKPKIYEGGLFSDSSKIKAAVEILQSLPRSGSSLNSDFQTYKGEANGLGNGVNTVSQGGSAEVSDQRHLYSDKCSNGHVTEKAIVFSQWTRMLDLLEVPLKGSFIQYRRLDGTMSVSAREKAVKEFNTLPEVTVMIMSLKAASLGLNMVAACHVILLDLWWNPTTEDQAIDRAHRIGQTRPVTVSRLTVEGTVEDRILALQERKREMVASAFGEDESGSRQTRLTVEDLKYLFMV